MCYQNTFIIFREVACCKCVYRVGLQRAIIYTAAPLGEKQEEYRHSRTGQNSANCKRVVSNGNNICACYPGMDIF